MWLGRLCNVNCRRGILWYVPNSHRQSLAAGPCFSSYYCWVALPCFFQFFFPPFRWASWVKLRAPSSCTPSLDGRRATAFFETLMRNGVSAGMSLFRGDRLWLLPDVFVCVFLFVCLFVFLEIGENICCK